MAPAPKYSPEEELTRILAAAERCINDTSLLDFTMSALAKEAGISIGSVYKHVQSKEDVLIALANHMFQEMAPKFERVMQLELTLPERLLAVTLIDPSLLHPYQFAIHLQKLIINEAILCRASAEWVIKMVNSEKRLNDIFSQYVSQAAQQEIICQQEDGVCKKQNITAITEQLSVALWSLNVGFDQVNYHLRSRSCVGLSEDFVCPYPLQLDHAFVQATIRLINSFSWQKPFDESRFDQVCQQLIQHNLR